MMVTLYEQRNEEADILEKCSRGGSFARNCRSLRNKVCERAGCVQSIG